MKTLFAALAFVGVLALGAETASAASAAYCDSQARQYASSRAGPNTVGGAIMGGIGGAVVGGLLGGKGGAVAGGAVGGVGGAAVGSSTWRKYYNQAYYDCINAPAARPVYAKPAYPPPPAGMARATASLKVRSAPAINAPMIWVIPPGGLVSVGQCTPDGWCAVNGPGGPGWAASQYLYGG
jgi:uncharacterized protein YraI